MGPLRGYGGMCRWCGGLPCSLSCVSRGPGDLAILWENLSHCGPRRCISVPTPQYSGASRVGWPCKRGPFRRRLNEAFSPAAQTTKLPSELRAPSSGPSIRNRGQLDIDLPAAPGHILVDSAAAREICARYGPQTDAFFRYTGVQIYIACAATLAVGVRQQDPPDRGGWTAAHFRGTCPQPRQLSLHKWPSLPLLAARISLPCIRVVTIAPVAPVAQRVFRSTVRRRGLAMASARRTEHRHHTPIC